MKPLEKRNYIIRIVKKISALLIITLSLYQLASAQTIDHTCINLNAIPDNWIDSAKTKLFIGYGHTSHGNQIATGMNAIENYFTNGKYNWSHSGGINELHLFEGSGYSSGYLDHDIGYSGWDDKTRTYLDDFPDCNVIIWSWCGQVNEVNLQSHLFTPMELLESEYPDVTFVYMTGHLEGRGPDGSLKAANDKIRDYCSQNHKFLFDFADIEKYDPNATTNYQEYYANDECDYDPDGAEPVNRTQNWATNWLSANPDHELTSISGQCGSCSHSVSLNCVMKGAAIWHLWACLAGWDGSLIADTISPTTPQNLSVTIVSESRIDLSWNASSDNVGVTGYKIIRDGTELTTTTDTTYSNTGLEAETQYEYGVLAFDAAGNISDTSAFVSVTTNPIPTDDESPTTPQNLSASVASESQIDLSWNASIDNVGVTGYKIIRDGIELTTTTNTTYSNTGLEPETEYVYGVLAYDAAGNISDTSNVISATTQASPNIIQNIGNESVQVYPNPARENIHIRMKDYYKSEIISLEGRKLIFSKRKIINIEHLPIGIYMIKVVDKHGNAIIRRISITK